MMWVAKLVALAASLALTECFTADFPIQVCNTSVGCVKSQKRIALDVGSNGTASLIQVSGNALKLSYGGAVTGGPRVYLIEEDGVNKNHLFMLKNQEFAFDVDLSTMPCGFNAALYFVGMDSNAGGAESGTNYCDAQAVAGVFCSEMDIWEANLYAQQFTTHACIDTCGSFSTDPKCKGNGSPETVCDQSGCGLNPFRYGPGTTYNSETQNTDFYGPGKDLDSKQPFTVLTRFYTDTSGELANITRIYVQNGKRIDLPTLYVKPPTDGQHMGAFSQPAITKDFCVDIYDRWNGGNANDFPLEQMGNNMDAGMVLTMSAWYAKEVYPLQGGQTGMSWLDGTNNWGKLIKAGPCDTTTTDTGVHYANFSNIRFGDIGSTVPSLPSPPSPPPSPPSPPGPNPPSPPGPNPPSPPGPSPSGGKCCYSGCNSGNCHLTGFCAQSKANCVGNCNGEWCPDIAAQ